MSIVVTIVVVAPVAIVIFIAAPAPVVVVIIPTTVVIMAVPVAAMDEVLQDAPARHPVDMPEKIVSGRGAGQRGMSEEKCKTQCEAFHRRSPVAQTE